jgi:hypothetical protein
VGNIITTVGDGSLVASGVTVGTRVLVAVGSAEVDVGPGVGKKFGRVGVTVAVVDGGIGVGAAGAIKIIGLINSNTIMAIKTTTTNPANTPIVSACERVKLCLPSLDAATFYPKNLIA